MTCPEQRALYSRRQFLKAGGAAGGGLVVALQLPLVGCTGEEQQPTAAVKDGDKPAPEQFRPNAFVRIAPSGDVILTVHKSEMGQGVHTSLATILAEELNIDPAAVTVEMAPEHADYRFGRGMGTGGSTSVRFSWEPLALAGATARVMLVQAAAQQWGVAPSGCETDNGQVIGPDGRRLGYGELASAAAGLPLPEGVAPKSPETYRYIGKPVARVDTPSKVDGSAVFGIDVQLPGLLTAVVIRPPAFGATLKSVDDAEVLAMPGVKKVVAISGGVGVVATGYWEARQAAAILAIEWQPGPHAENDDAAIAALLEGEADVPGAVSREQGDALAELSGASDSIEAVYRLPFLAHATLEPMNCTARVGGGHCEIWAPTQGQTRARQTAMRLTGLPEGSVEIHTTYLGGGFGRRFEVDFVTDAVELSMAAGAPVKVIWSREEDMRNDFYRPASWHRLRARVVDGKPVAWHHHLVGPSILWRLNPGGIDNGVDRTLVEGARDLPYRIPNILVDSVLVLPHVPVGYWRSVGSSHNGFVVESFIDELAHAAGGDPVAFRRSLLADHPRHLGVLERAAAEANWGEPLPDGHYHGVAVHESYGSIVAQIAEVSVAADNQPRVHKVTCVIDCGRIVNPDTVAAQMESGIVYGLTAALMGEINIAAGGVRQSNFHDYPLLRFDQMPQVSAHIIDSDAAPGGVGEPATPPIAAAVCNAIFAATGKRIRALPIRLDG